MTINPLVAGVLAAVLLGEPFTLNLAVGLIAVFAGIWIATTERPVPSKSAPSSTG